jgi:hypothetical protein
VGQYRRRYISARHTQEGPSVRDGLFFWDKVTFTRLRELQKQVDRTRSSNVLERQSLENYLEINLSEDPGHFGHRCDPTHHPDSLDVHQ